MLQCFWWSGDLVQSMSMSPLHRSSSKHQYEIEPTAVPSTYCFIFCPAYSTSQNSMSCTLDSLWSGVFMSMHCVCALPACVQTNRQVNMWCLQEQAETCRSAPVTHHSHRSSTAAMNTRELVTSEADLQPTGVARGSTASLQLPGTYCSSRILKNLQG